MKMTAGRFVFTINLTWLTALSVMAVESEKHFEGPYHITITPRQKVRATVTSRLGVPNLVAYGGYVSSPPEFEGQPMARGRVEIADAPFAEVALATDEGALRQALIALHWFPGNDYGAQNVMADAVYEVTITRRTLEPGEPIRPVPRLRPFERSAFLAPTIHFDYSSRIFRSWLRKHDLKRKSGERDLDFAYRAMETLHKTHVYRSEPMADSSASAVCARGWGACGGLSMVYLSTLRANCIPACTGRTIEPDDTHAKVDFYAEAVGWVPCDPAAAMHSADAGFGREHFDMVITTDFRFGDRDVACWHWYYPLGIIEPGGEAGTAGPSSTRR